MIGDSCSRQDDRRLRMCRGCTRVQGRFDRLGRGLLGGIGGIRLSGMYVSTNYLGEGREGRLTEFWKASSLVSRATWASGDSVKVVGSVKRAKLALRQ